MFQHLDPPNSCFTNLENLYKNLKFIKKGNRGEQERRVKMEMKRDIRVERKDVEEENMCTSLLTAFVVLTLACLKHFSSVSYLIEQWRSLVFLLLNFLLLAVYFTSTRDFKARRGSRFRMARGKRNKKSKKTKTMEEQACPDQEFSVVEPKEVIKYCVVEETKRVCPEIEEVVKDCSFHKKAVEFNGKGEEFETGRLSNEELNEKVETFIKTFRQHLVLDARRGRDRETDHKMRSKDSDISLLGHEVTCSV